MDKKIASLLSKTKNASYSLNLLSFQKRNSILKEIAKQLKKNAKKIITDNKKDLKKYSKDHPLHDRLLLNQERIKGIISDIQNVIKLPDPLNRILEKKNLKNGMHLKKITVPLGVIGIIYEARPNVTIDAAVLCIKSGNAVVLRGASDCIHSNKILVKLMKDALKKHKIPEDCIQLYPPDRSYVPDFLKANEYIDVIIPRGSEKLIQMTRKNASVPVIETGAGVVHTFVDESCNLKKSSEIVFNAKVHRPSVCNALDTAIIHEKIYRKFLPELAVRLKEKKVEIRADNKAHSILCKIYPKALLKKAKESDYGKEYLSLKMSIKVVKNIDEALEHIRKYSSKHTEAILTKNISHQKRFLSEVDAAAVFVNASTRFTDGAQFEIGAEIGISTQKLHARGPMGLNELTSYKWQIIGKNHIRK